MSSAPLCPEVYMRHSGAFPGFNSETFAKTNVTRRRKREFTPDEQKDDNYWLKRSRNNEAAKRSRLRRRMEERMLETRTAQLLRENEKLKAALSTIHYRNFAFKYPLDPVLDYPLAQDVSVRPILPSAADLPLTPFPGANSLYNVVATARCASDAPVHHFPPGMENFTASLPLSPANLLDTQRGRNFGSQWNVPACGDPNYSPVTCLPFAQEMNGIDTYVRPLHLSQTDFPPSFSLNRMGHVYAHPSGNVSECGATLLTDASYVGKDGPLISEEKKKEEVMKEAGRASASPLLPHKLRYKANRVRDVAANTDYYNDGAR